MVVYSIAANAEHTLQNMVKSPNIATKSQKIQAMFQYTSIGHTAPVQLLRHPIYFDIAAANMGIFRHMLIVQLNTVGLGTANYRLLL